MLESTRYSQLSYYEIQDFLETRNVDELTVAIVLLRRARLYAIEEEKNRNILKLCHTGK